MTETETGTERGDRHGPGRVTRTGLGGGAEVVRGGGTETGIEIVTETGRRGRGPGASEADRGVQINNRQSSAIFQPIFLKIKFNNNGETQCDYKN